MINASESAQGEMDFGTIQATDAAPLRIGHLLVEPIDGVPGRPWCLHSAEPHSAWIEFYKSREEAAEDARAMLERNRKQIEEAV